MELLSRYHHEISCKYEFKWIKSNTCLKEKVVVFDFYTNFLRHFLEL